MGLKRRRYLGYYWGWLLVFTQLIPSNPTRADSFFEEAPLPQADQLGFTSSSEEHRPPTHGSMNMLVIFAKFAGDDSVGETLPSFTNSLFDGSHPGSFTHFYNTMSMGQLQIQGTVLPRYYSSDRGAAAYLAPNGSEHGRYGDFVGEILKKVDADYDMAEFDNDGPDGRPNSGDDNGFVDYIFIVMPSVPANFLIGGATGIAGFNRDSYPTNDLSVDGKYITVLGTHFHGSILEGKDHYAQTVGTMAHEFGHALGRNQPLPDLYDTSHLSNPDQGAAEYSAGIGQWGLMGLGTLGWQRDGQIDGPNPFCAWSLEQLGWIGQRNKRLVEVRRDTKQVHIGDLFDGGSIYKIPLNTEVFLPTASLHPQYLLLEYRSKSSHYYNRHQPGEGLLVWRFKSFGGDNKDEKNKLLDLVCADGLYSDRGFDLGQERSPRRGRDNLDFWAKDAQAVYRENHAGNAGDSTDLFDGQHFFQLEGESNPSSYFDATYTSAYKPLVIGPMQRTPNGMVLDINMPRWAGTIQQETHWSGEILVDGDISVTAEGRLVLYPGTRVLMAATDRLGSGQDPAQIEFAIEGQLVIQSESRSFDHDLGKWQANTTASAPIVFEAITSGHTWAGITLHNPEGLVSAKTLRGEYPELDPAWIVLRDTLSHDGQQLVNVPTAVEIDTFSLVADADSFALLPNYPNPFETQTTLPYALAQNAPVQLTIYNTLGQKVKRLVDEYQQAGQYQAKWDGRDGSGQQVGRGVYLSILEVADLFAARHKMLHLSSGFSQIGSLQEHLRQQNIGTESLKEVVRAQQEEALGLSDAAAPIEQAAFVVGWQWVALQVLVHSGGAAPVIQAQAQDLLDWLALFDPTPAVLQQLEFRFLGLSSSPPAQALAALGPLGLRLSYLIERHNDSAGLYFHLGQWLQSLELAALSARQQASSLVQLLDAQADADAARTFAAALRTYEDGESIPSGLEQLAGQLEDGPRTLLQDRAILDQITQIAALLQGR